MTCRDHDVIFPPCSTLVRTSLDYVAILEPFSCEGYVKILGMVQRPSNNNYQLGVKSLINKAQGTRVIEKQKRSVIRMKSEEFQSLQQCFSKCAPEPYPSASPKMHVRNANLGKIPNLLNRISVEGGENPTRIMHTEVENLCASGSQPQLHVGIIWRPTSEILINWPGMTPRHQT